MNTPPPSPDARDVRSLYERLKPRQEAQGYFFNPDDALVQDLLAGLLINRSRYGYMSCPCRLAAGDRERDRDIICPCDYRAADVEEYGTCYCGLYVSPAVQTGQASPAPVPERRPAARLHC
ncbi:MAG: hypothetical protein Kow00122_04580 [Thermoleophilia bacterium]